MCASKIVPVTDPLDPVIFAVIVPAAKLPDESRLTIVEGVFKFVAAFAACSDV